MRTLAGKAQEATVFIQRYNQVRNDLERQVALDHVNDLYHPHVQVFHHKTYGLVLFARPGVTAPRALLYSANIIVAIDAAGFGAIEKCKVTPSERLTAVDLAKTFAVPITIPDGLRLTRWQAIEEDWI